ncbi:taurine ABC transporter substrate-binding protein [Companilactobacillus nodensis]|uniref:Aliphatic sulfonates family ABC transporter periplasmic ligand-binding protein n=1 Tax=Companilactobacillus nodensis DSM 19682 = JCM 14932 = NBRC 107160 TaxID=1423775 RepID=A0A0R1KH06_9LACO|nr:glycine betaine ABC transporter substrate-binding protein [Companilactobacillus nodensis]KRK79226.1 aliphatic sulfonates family ABC transporter periplasmic ligand-binding protein [Companilactobacillus nodensis DSM 19682 = JCM 14932 = NBRC 107160]
MRKTIKVLAVVFSLLLIMTGCSNRKNDPKKVSEVRIGILQVPNDVAAARQLNYLKAYFDKKHIQTKYIIFDSGVDANKALVSGDIDFATMGDTNGVVAMSSKIDAKLIWVNDVLGNNEGLVVRNGSGIKDFQDLAGQKIATPFASTSHYSLMMTLKKYNLLDKVSLLDMDTQDIVAAWNRGDISAAYTWQPTLTPMLKNGHFLITSENLRNQNRVTANITLVRGGFERSHPELVKGLLQQLNRTHQEMQTDSKKIITAASKQNDLGYNEAKSQIGTSEWLTAKQMVDQKFLTETFQEQLYITGRFMAQQQTIDHAPTKKEISNFVASNYVEELGDK